MTRSLVARLPPVEEIEELSSAHVLQVFDMKGKGTIAGCNVEGGTFVADQLVQVCCLLACLPVDFSVCQASFLCVSVFSVCA